MAQQQQQGGAPVSQGVSPTPLPREGVIGHWQPLVPQPPPGAAPPAPPRRPDPGSILPENVDEAFAVISNTTALLNEMLASESDPREGFVAELAQQCIRMKR